MDVGRVGEPELLIENIWRDLVGNRSQNHPRRSSATQKNCVYVSQAHQKSIEIRAIANV